MNILAKIYILISYVQILFNKVYSTIRNAYLVSRGAHIGKNVKIGKRVRVILEKNSHLKIMDNVEISDDCWIIVHEDSSLCIDEHVYISHHCVVSSNSKVDIGSYTAIGPYTIILDTDKNFKNPNEIIRKQGSTSSPIIVAKDVWIGSFCVITKGVEIGQHSVVAAHSVITKDVKEFTLNAGVPSKLIYRIEE
ncbi:hypothetical protein ACEOWG_001483 [Bacillus cereus]